MNLPNKLTLARTALIPVMVALMYLPGAWCRWAAVAVFALASLTDWLDGRIARSRNLVTDFGKFLDPVADKVLVLSAMVMLEHLELLPAWCVLAVAARELAVDGLRLVAATKGKVIAAGWLGKIKTTSQMILILALMALRVPADSHWALMAMTVWVALITLWSGVDYFLKNRENLKS